MAVESGRSSPRIFLEEEVRHLLAREVQRGTRYQDFLCVCLVRPGYPDAPIPTLLSAVAQEIADMLRATDIVGIIGGDIVVLLVHTPASDGLVIRDRIRERIEAMTFSSITDGRVTLRIGLSCFPTDATADAALLAHAQTQLPSAPGRR